MKISVLMACYNAAQYICEAVDSILHQSFFDFEFVIVDDGSEDDTLAIINSYSDPRINVVSLKQNIGLIGALNVGLQHCRGEYIARMDADDVSMKERLAKQKEFLDNNSDVVAVGSSVVNFNRQGVEVRIDYPIDHIAVMLHLMMFERTISHPAVMFRKDVIIRNGIQYRPQWLLCEDYYLWYELSQYGKLANLRTPLIKYYRGVSQSSNKYREIQRQNTKKLLYEILAKYKFQDLYTVVDFLMVSKNYSKHKRSLSHKLILSSELFLTEFNGKKIKEILAFKEIRYCHQYSSGCRVVLAVLNYLFCSIGGVRKRLFFLIRINQLARIKR